MARTGPSARSGSGASGTARERRSARSSDVRQEPSTGKVAAARDRLVRSVLAPLNAVLLTRKHIEEVLDDAVSRGRMTRSDAQEMAQSLLTRSARATDDFLADVERMLGGRGDALGGRAGRRAADSRSPATTISRRPRCRSDSTASPPRAAAAARLRAAPREPQDGARPDRPQAAIVRSLPPISARGIGRSDLVQHHREVQPLACHLGEQLVGVQALTLAPQLAQQVAGLAAR